MDMAGQVRTIDKRVVGETLVAHIVTNKWGKSTISSLSWPQNDYNRLPYFSDQLNASELPEEVKELLIDCAEACMNFGQKFGFEFSPRNLSTKDGKLVFLDCFYLLDTLQSVRTGKVRV